MKMFKHKDEEKPSGLQHPSRRERLRCWSASSLCTIYAHVQEQRTTCFADPVKWSRTTKPPASCFPRSLSSWKCFRAHPAGSDPCGLGYTSVSHVCVPHERHAGPLVCCDQYILMTPGRLADPSSCGRRGCLRPVSPGLRRVAVLPHGVHSLASAHLPQASESLPGDQCGSVPFLCLSVETAPRGGTQEAPHPRVPSLGARDPGLQDGLQGQEGLPLGLAAKDPWAQSSLRAGQLCVTPFALTKPARWVETMT